MLIEYNTWIPAFNYKCPADPDRIIGKYDCADCPFYNGVVSEYGKHYIDCSKH